MLDSWLLVQVETNTACTVQGLVLFFFFQAEDGIRDYKVTGVQTCALPICSLPEPNRRGRSITKRKNGSTARCAPARWASAARWPARTTATCSRGSPPTRTPDRKSVV